jgi:flagellar biosynthesis protein FlhG
MAALSAVQQAAIVRAFSTLHGSLDVLIVDTAPGIGESVLQFCQAAQQILVVLRDEPTSLTDTYALIKVLSRSHGVRHFRVLANMTRHAGQGDGVFRRLQRVTDRYLEVALDFVGEIPEDGALQKAVQAQRPVLEVFPLSPAAQAFNRLASVASRWPLPDGASGRLEFFLERMLRRPAARLKVLK